jgi:glycolate oxidase iron-sulfur subunit
MGLQAAIVRKNGLPWLKAAIFAGLKSPAVLDGTMKLGAVLQGLVFARIRLAQFAAVAIRDPGQAFRLQRKSSCRLAARPCATGWRSGPGAASNAGGVLHRVLISVFLSGHRPGPDRRVDGEPCRSRGAQTATLLRHVLVHGDVEARERWRARTSMPWRAQRPDHRFRWLRLLQRQHEFLHTLAGDPDMLRKAAYWSSRTLDISTFLTKIIQYRVPEEGGCGGDVPIRAI